MIRFILPIVYLIEATTAIDSLRVAFQWKQVDFEYPSRDERFSAVNSRQFIPENNVPSGMAIYGDRIFLTLPRWKEGVAASLAYISTTDRLDSPILRPYPNWAAHDLQKGNQPLISAYRLAVDSCDRLWVLDPGTKNILQQNIEQVLPPRILIYNLKTDLLLRAYTIPDDQWNKNNSSFANIAIEESNCTHSYAYLADPGYPALFVYDLHQNRSWIIRHRYFDVDPLAQNMTVSRVTYDSPHGLVGLALSDRNSEGFSTLYFHPMASFNEFTISTKVLRNEELVQNATAFNDTFKSLGSRGPKAQSGASFLHKKSKILFYALINLNAVACWRTTLTNYSMESQGRIFMNNELMVFPDDIKVDANDTLWVLSNKLPIFMYDYLNYRDYNFRILKSSIKEAIRGTTCDSKIVADMEILKNITKTNKHSASTGIRSSMYFTISIILLAIVPS